MQRKRALGHSDSDVAEPDAAGDMDAAVQPPPRKRHRLADVSRHASPAVEADNTREAEPDDAAAAAVGNGPSAAGASTDAAVRNQGNGILEEGAADAEEGHGVAEDGNEAEVLPDEAAEEDIEDEGHHRSAGEDADAGVHPMHVDKLAAHSKSQAAHQRHCSKMADEATANGDEEAGADEDRRPAALVESSQLDDGGDGGTDSIAPQNGTSLREADSHDAAAEEILERKPHLAQSRAGEAANGG